MKIRQSVGLVSAILGVLMATSTAAVAAPKYGCPAERSGWSEVRVEEAAETIWDGLIDPSPWGDFDTFEGAVAAVDGNGDGNVCLAVREKTNPNSHWYKVGMEVLGEPASLFIALDNNANASNLE